MIKNLLTTTLFCAMLAWLPSFATAQIYTDEQIAAFPQSFDPLMVYPKPDSTYLIGLQVNPYGEWGILKTDKFGRAYTGYVTYLQSSINTYPRAVVTSDGNIVFSGKKNINASTRCVVAKFDPFGNALWGLQYPDMGSDKLIIHDIIALDSGAVLLSGIEVAAGRPWISKVNASGQVVWEWAYTGVGAAAFRITNASNGGFYGALRVGSANFYLGRFDKNGLPMWYKQGTNSLASSEVKDLKNLPNGRLAALLGGSNSFTRLCMFDTLGNALSVQTISGIGSNYGKMVPTDSMIFVSLQSDLSPADRHGILAFDANGVPKRYTRLPHNGAFSDFRNGICKSVDGVAVLHNTSVGMNLILADSMGSYPCADTHFVPTFSTSTATLTTISTPVPLAPIIPASPMAFSNMVGLFSNSQTICSYCPYPQPLANFSYTINGLHVQFQNLSTNADSYDWTLGDNIASTDTHPSITYPSEGPRLVCLEANSGCYSDTQCVSLPPLTDVEALNIFNTSLVPGNNSIQFSFRNNTATTINTLQLSYRANNFTPVTETWSGTLAAGDSAVYTFANPLNITLPHQMTLDAWVKFPQPTLGNSPANDTARTTICMSLAGSYDVGGGNEDIVSFAQAMRELRDCGLHGAVTLRLFGNPQGGFLGGYTATMVNPSGLYPIKVTYGTGYQMDTVSFTEVFQCKRMSFVGLKILAGVGFGAIVPCDGARFVFCEDVLVDSCDIRGSTGALAFKGCKNFAVTNSHLTGGLSTIIHNTAPIPPPAENSGLANFSNNTIEAIGNGICIDGDQRNVDFVMDHNTIQECYAGLNVISDKSIKSLVFSNNRIIDVWASGVYLGVQCGNCISVNGLKFFNNMITVKDTATASWALAASSFGPMYIDHNSFFGRVSLTSGAQAYEVFNNIFAGWQTDYLIQGSFWRDYNCYFLRDTSMEIMPGYPTLTDLQAGFPGRDIHSFVADPGFVSATDLHTTSPSIVDRGTYLTITATDIDGDAYSNPPDVGADENGLVIVTREENERSELIVSPSVFQSYLDIQWPGHVPGTACKAELVSLTGQTLAATTFDLPEYRWNLSDLPIGPYGLTIHREGYRSVTVKVIHLR